MTKTIIRIFTVCIFLLPANIFAQLAKTVIIKGQLKNFSNQAEIEDLSDLQYLLPPNSERVIIPDQEGNFSVQFKLETPNYFRLGRNILYLTPGDNLEVFIDKNDPRNAAFKGKGSSANLYLRNTPFPKGGSFIEAGSKVKPTAKATIDYILEAGALRKKALEDLGNVSKEFKRLEQARIQADIINSVNSGQRSYKPRISKDSLKVYEEEYNLLMQPVLDKYTKNFVDASFMKLVVYRDVADGLIKKSPAQNGVQQIKDWMESSSLVRKMNQENDKQQLKKFRSEIAAIKTIKYRNALDKSLDNLLQFGKGDTAVDFSAEDMEGNIVKLSSLKGKVIYVDLWATWCGPCMEEMPFFEKLKEKYKDNPGVVFVSLSIDDGKELWKNNVIKRNANGIQWLINRNKLSAYNIVGIPRTLIIDKNFKMVEMNAPVPSSKDSEKIINQLLD